MLIPTVQSPELSNPAFRLLTACAYYLADNWLAQRNRIEAALNERPDKSVFLYLVGRHRLWVLVNTVLIRVAKELGRDLSEFIVPRERMLQVKSKSFALHIELQRLQSLFTQANIGVTPLKGSTLSKRLYGDASLRHVRDIDLLVSPNNIPAAVALLQSAGYQVEPLPLGRKQSFKLTQATWWHIECRHSQTNLLVELHWRIEEVRSKSLEPRWQEWIHTTDSTLRDRYELLYLCLHGASHDWRRLKWLGDVHMLVTHLQEDDWLPLIDLAVYLRMEGLLAQTLLLLNWLFDFELPSAAKTLVTTQGRYATLLAKTALAEILNSEEAYELKMTAIWKNLKIPIQVSRRHRLHERVVYWLSIHCLRKGDLLAIPLPISLVWLYPLIRLPSILVRCLLSWKRHKLA